jgi:UDP-glucose 4-epimerase
LIKILITGGAGFIGSSLAIRLLQNPLYYVVIVDNLLTGEIAKVPLHERCKFIKGDENVYVSDGMVFKLDYEWDVKQIFSLSFKITYED